MENKDGNDFYDEWQIKLYFDIRITGIIIVDD